jgi:beta-N-acetylhexosaminidase
MREALKTIDTIKTPGISQKLHSDIPSLDTLQVPSIDQQETIFLLHAARPTQPTTLSRAGTALLLLLLSIVVLHATNVGPSGFLGTQGWAYVLNGSANTNNPNLLKGVTNQNTTPGANATAHPQLTPEQYINLIVQRMTLDQKLGQMMIVQFTGPSYSYDLSTMVNQYGVGAVLIFAANQNIQDKAQLKSLIQQIQANSTVPLAVAIDQEGGYVDRLVSLDGPRPSEAKIGATNNPAQATAEGTQDAQDLTSYGFNLNLAPVVDVTNVYNAQLYTRTYGNNPDLVTRMAAAYLQGLQKSGKVLGTLKHFPGLGDVSVDPHVGVPRLTRSLNNLENIDWAPYRTLIQQGTVHAVMVTHELVTSLDSTIPSSLSYKVVTGILRQKLGFQGVIMTDSLTMEGIFAYYPEAQAAAMAVEAGNDLLMGATSPSDVASMIEGIKHAMSNGDISQQRIDDSVRRILMMKYAMGLLPIPTT